MRLNSGSPALQLRRSEDKVYTCLVLVCVSSPHGLFNFYLLPRNSEVERQFWSSRPVHQFGEKRVPTIVDQERRSFSFRLRSPLCGAIRRANDHYSIGTGRARCLPSLGFRCFTSSCSLIHEEQEGIGYGRRFCTPYCDPAPVAKFMSSVRVQKKIVAEVKHPKASHKDPGLDAHSRTRAMSSPFLL